MWVYINISEMMAVRLSTMNPRKSGKVKSRAVGLESPLCIEPFPVL